MLFYDFENQFEKKLLNRVRIELLSLKRFVELYKIMQNNQIIVSSPE